jgi:hypothetical protein
VPEAADGPSGDRPGRLVLCVRAASKQSLRFPSGRYCKARSHDPKRLRLTTTIDEKLVRRRAHENNIARYRRLLQTRLSDVERHFIESRLAEEQTALSLSSQANSSQQRCVRFDGRGDVS